MAEQKINQRIMGGACTISRTAAYRTNIKTEQKANFPLERKFALTEQTRYTIILVNIPTVFKTMLQCTFLEVGPYSYRQR